jgi:hypothetical protein
MYSWEECMRKTPVECQWGLPALDPFLICFSSLMALQLLSKIAQQIKSVQYWFTLTCSMLGLVRLQPLLSLTFLKGHPKTSVISQLEELGRLTLWDLPQVQSTIIVIALTVMKAIWKSPSRIEGVSAGINYPSIITPLSKKGRREGKSLLF